MTTPTIPSIAPKRSRVLHHPRAIYWLLGILFAGYVCLTVNGYGNHDDIYRMIGTWRTLLSENRYVPSRFQGNLIPELTIGLSSQLGGFHLSNLVSAILATCSLFFFYQLLVLVVPSIVALLAVAAVGTNPYWMIAAVTSTDYIYPAFFFLLGLTFLRHDRARLAAIPFAMAVSSRLTYGPIIAIAFGCFLWYFKHEKLRRDRLIQGFLLFLFGSASLYLPVFFTSGMSFSFLGFASDTAGGKLGVLARFIYKNIYLWGLPTFLLLVGFLVQQRRFFWERLQRNPIQSSTSENVLFYGVFLVFLFSELLFAKLPHQYQYLIPVLFCVAYFIAIVPNLKKAMICLGLIAILHLFYAVCSFDILQTYQVGTDNPTIHSDGAKVQFSIKEGVLVRDFQWRSRYQRHLTEAFNQRWSHYGPPLENPR